LVAEKVKMNFNKWRELTALLSANALSMIGNSISAIAIPVFVLNMTGSATFTAVIVMAGQIPNILVGIVSGHFIDRFSAKSVSLFSDIVNALAIGLIPFLFNVEWLDMWVLGTLVFLSQVLDSQGSTARRVMIPELIDKHGLPRERVNGLDSLIETGADLIGPIIASTLLALTSALFLLWVDAVTFLISFLILAVGVKARKPNAEKEVPLLLKQGWVWMFNNKLVLKLGLYDFVVNAVATSLLALTLPALAKSMDEQYLWLGVWLACFAAGTTLTTLAYTFFGHKVSELNLLKLTPFGQAVGLGLILATVVFQWPLFMVAVGLFFYGVNLGVGSMVDAMLLQKQVPETLRGTVFAAFSSFRFLGVPVGLLFAGVLLDAQQVSLLFSSFIVMLGFTTLIWWRVESID
jgi:MFS family permease